MQMSHHDPARVLLLGGIILDRYFEIEHYPAAGGDALIRNAYERVGGCCINVAVTLQNLGATPLIVSQVGDDDAGKSIERYLDAQGLPKDYIRKVPRSGSGYCLNILESSGERTFFTYRGCEDEFLLEWFPIMAMEEFAFVYITGYYLLQSQTAAQVIELAAKLRQEGCQVLFDPGALVSEVDRDHLKELLRCVDWLAPNTNELALIAAMLDARDDAPAWLFEQGVRGLAIKRGRHGVEVFTPAFTFAVKSLPVRCVDSTGAGDSFAGGLIYGLAYGYSLYEAVALGNACGALACTFIGPHARFSLNDVQNLRKLDKD